MRIISIFLFITILLVGCNQHKQKNSSTETNLHVVDLYSSENFSENGIVAEVGIIKLETNSNCLIGKIDKLIVSNDKIWILDKNIAKTLFVFSLKGDFINTIGKVGKGPGEYMEGLNDFFVDSVNNEIVLLSKLGEVITCDFNGNFKQLHKIEKYYPENMWHTTDSFIFRVNISCNSLKNNDQSFKICVTDRKLKEEKYQFIQDTFDKDILPFDSGERFYCQSSAGLFFRKNFTDTIYKFESGEFAPCAVFNAKNDIQIPVIIDKAYIEEKEKIGLKEIQFIDENFLFATFSKSKSDIVGVLHSFKTGRTLICNDEMPLLPYPFSPEYSYNGFLYGHSTVLEIKEHTDGTIKYGKEMGVAQNIIDLSKEINKNLNVEDNPCILVYKLTADL